MICEFRDAVAAQVLGGLPAREAVALDQHVLGCDSCVQHRRELTMVRTLLDSLEPAAGGSVPGPGPGQPPAALGDVVVTGMLARRQRRPLRDLRLVLAGAAAAAVLGILPLGAYTWTHRPGPATRLELVGTAAAPGAWGEVKLYPRADGTIVDFEAGALPRTGGRYLVTVAAGGTVVARQEFTADGDGWGQVLLAAGPPASRGYSIDVQRLDGAHPVPVLRSA